MYQHRHADKGWYLCQACQAELLLHNYERKLKVEYRKQIDLDPNTSYFFVHMGELNRLNGPSNYPFTSEEAALRFANNHKLIAKQQYGVDRDIEVRYPDGTVQVIA